jgi:hypothetical protein
MTNTGPVGRGAGRRCAAALALCALAGCWESAAPAADGDDPAADGGADESTDPLVGWSCSDLSPCVQSDLSGFTCPGFPPSVRCWDLGAACDASYLCASTGQACEIVCAATACEASAAIPPHPVCAD